jgi:hypothetical protein
MSLRVVLVSTVLLLSNTLMHSAIAAEPVYSDTNLPILENVDYRLDIVDSLHVTAYVDFTVSYKINPISSVYFNFNAPTYSAIEKPCLASIVYQVMGQQTLTDLGNNRTLVKSVVNLNLSQFITGVTLDLCKGKWGLSPIAGTPPLGTNINLYDIAGHSRQYTYSYSQDLFYQSSTLWKLDTSVKPNCEKFDTTIFAICDSPFDFSKIKSAYFEVSEQTISEIKNKELEALKAADKAAADKAAAAADKAAADKAAADKAAADKAAADKIIADTKFEAARKLAEAKARALFATKKTSITCVKGKLTKKVIAVKPKCPAGYKKK